MIRNIFFNQARIIKILDIKRKYFSSATVAENKIRENVSKESEKASLILDQKSHFDK